MATVYKHIRIYLYSHIRIYLYYAGSIVKHKAVKKCLPRHSLMRRRVNLGNLPHYPHTQKQGASRGKYRFQRNNEGFFT